MQKKINTYFQKKYLFKGIISLSFFSLFFFGNTMVAEAQATDGALNAAYGVTNAVLNPGGAIASYVGGEVTGNIFQTMVNGVLYALLVFLVHLTQVAAAMFAWATQPEYISGPTGLLNLDSVYKLWAFIRDFFNLFFIFLLLFSAFATVFQIEQYSIKKNFFKIVLAAIIINFSFPFTRIIIDAGNVPMYFFADGLSGLNRDASGNALTGISSLFLSTSGMAQIVLLPKDSVSNMDTTQLLSGVIFTFIFMITLLMLAFLFLLRLLKLVILLIFSPAGLVGAVIPALKPLGSKWMKQLLQTVFWGPAAMLMVVIALRFTAQLQTSEFATGLAATAPAATGASQTSIITQGIFFIPVIMMWMAMMVAKQSGIQGAKFITDRGDKAIAWGKKAGLGTAKYATYKNPVARGAISGVKKRAYEGRLLGDKVKTVTGGKLGAKAWKESGQDTEARVKGFIDKGSKGADVEKRKAENRRVQDKMKQFKDDLLERSDLEGKLIDPKTGEMRKNGDPIEMKAAALSLAENKDGIKKESVLQAALTTFKGEHDYEKFEKILKSADDTAISMNTDQFKSVIDNQEILAMYAKAKGLDTPAEAKKKLVVDFGKQMKKVGGDIDKLFEYQTGHFFEPDISKGQVKITRAEIEKLYEDHKLTSKDLSQQSTLLRNTDFQDFAKQNFTVSEANELAKFVAQNNKNADVKVVVEDIKNAVSSWNRTQSAGQGGGTNQQSPGQQWQQNQANRNTRAQQGRANKSRPAGNP